MTTNIEQARFNMIEQQIRTWEVLDSRVLDVLRDVPREDFVPGRYRKLAFADLRLPIGQGQVMMKPVEEGRMLQAMDVQPGHRVLEIGTGSGFVAACLSALGAQVLSIDLHQELADSANSRLNRLGIDRVEVECADALGDFEPEQNFDRVLVTASATDMPVRFRPWVRQGGLLFVVRGSSPAMEAVCLQRIDADRWHAESLFETDLPRLIGAEDQPTFEF
ncbi:MAG: protein-L-isoaspartate O-methyltransferase [Wenzhouxiangella sp.]|jgi:protein-L-isoaspartate(D-aspartate) O-methyltransferase|nr:protein-L-isoaspartate O-methyltransferase [Wenzhouxiangella sp.]